ncbi:MAG TPA: hypothetical protein VMS75_11395 [Terriglobales bacterium]|nr:hypothetical protein [Terriglobales bacterium]
MLRFLYYAVAPAVLPARTMRQLLAEPRPGRAAAVAVGFVGLLYALTSAVMALAGAVPLTTVNLPIPPENYYFWQTLFILPWTALAGAATYGVLRLASGKEKRGPAAVRTAAAAGVALAASLFVAWVPAALAALFLALGMGQQELVDILSEPGGAQLIYVGLYVLAAAAAVVLFVLAARQGKAKKTAGLQATLAGVLAAAVLAVLFVVCVR